MAEALFFWAMPISRWTIGWQANPLTEPPLMDWLSDPKTRYIWALILVIRVASSVIGLGGFVVSMKTRDMSSDGLMKDGQTEHLLGIGDQIGFFKPTRFSPLTRYHSHTAHQQFCFNALALLVTDYSRKRTAGGQKNTTGSFP